MIKQPGFVPDAKKLFFLKRHAAAIVFGEDEPVDSNILGLSRGLRRRAAAILFFFLFLVKKNFL